MREIPGFDWKASKLNGVSNAGKSGNWTDALKAVKNTGLENLNP
jgi:hypothetical protein